MPTLVIECSDLAGSRRLGTTLLDHGHRLDVRRLHRGDALPSDLQGVDALLCLGGPQSANDDEIAWMPDVLALMKAAHVAGIPILGVCLGCQLLARALGGTVGAMPNGPRNGWGHVELTPDGREDPLHKGLPWSMMSFHWNNDCVVELPPDAHRLAVGADGDVQAWMLGVSTYGVQHHPEIDREQIGQWAADDAALLTERGVDVAELQSMSDREFDAFERLSNRFFESVAMLLMPLDRRRTAIAHAP
jgi:GMP synthase (glutamine-hydrolysing)